MTGLFYLITIVAGIYAQAFVSERLFVSGNAAVTAANILANKPLLELGFTAYLIEMICNVVITALFYVLLAPVNRTLSLVSAFVGLAGCAIKTVARFFYIAPLFVLSGSSTAFDIEQLQSLSMLLLRINDRGAGIALAFFGVSTLIKGFLILRSTFLPRFLGVLSILGGIGWLTYLSPPLGSRLFMFIAPIGLLGAVATIVWLLAFGVNEERWREQAAAAMSSS